MEVEVNHQLGLGTHPSSLSTPASCGQESKRRFEVDVEWSAHPDPELETLLGSIESEPDPIGVRRETAGCCCQAQEEPWSTPLRLIMTTRPQPSSRLSLESTTTRCE